MFKKNPLFCIVIVVCVLAFLGAGFLAFTESGKQKKTLQQLKSAAMQLNSQAAAEISPTEANLQASQQNVQELQRLLEIIRGDLRRGARLTSTDDGVRVSTGIQQYITEFQRRASTHTNADGESTPVSIPDDFGFGFDEFIDDTVIPDVAEEVIFLDKQRQVLSYIMTKLIGSSPEAIEAVAREAFPAEGENQPKGDSIFTVDEAITAAEPGAIQTLGFQVVFTGDTHSLRTFLNDLNKFDLPIVVRSIDVDRPSGEETTVAPKDGNNLDAIFGIFGDTSASVEDKQAAADQLAEPVILGNTSRFTVVLEYFEIIQQSTGSTETGEAQS